MSRSSLDGATRTVLQRDVHDPTAVAVSSGRVYVLDSHYRARQRGEKIDGAAYVTDRNGASWERVDALNLKVTVALPTNFPDRNKKFVNK